MTINSQPIRMQGYLLGLGSITITFSAIKSRFIVTILGLFLSTKMNYVGVNQCFGGAIYGFWLVWAVILPCILKQQMGFLTDFSTGILENYLFWWVNTLAVRHP